MTLLTREQIEARERTLLAPYAAQAADSRGRVYHQDEHQLRTSFQRDRDRIIHSAAFRRLEYKTQVFIPHERDHYRTRLTHTLEVAQISRTLARNLRLNEDLAEAVALVHDLGHTPFGHAGEHVLDDLLKENRGFNHNRQSLRVVDLLEQRYPDFPGLNLTYEVREGIAKHETSTPFQVDGINPDEKPTLEAALVDIADEIAYNAHDIDDGLASGLLSADDLRESLFWQRGVMTLPVTGESDDSLFRYALVRQVVNDTATDVLNESARRIDAHQITDLASVRECQIKLCGYSDSMQTIVRDLKDLLRSKLYRHPQLQLLSRQAETIMAGIFKVLRRKPEEMPTRFQQMLDSTPLDIVIADYIAGMTDRYAEQTYQRLQGG
jgi:dGTPase